MGVLHTFDRCITHNHAPSPPKFLMMIRATSTITVTPFQKNYSFAGACVDTKLRGASKELVV